MPDLPKVVVFDLGGVLVRIRRTPEEALSAVLSENEGPLVLRDQDSYSALNREYQSGGIALGAFLEQLANLLDRPIDEAVLRQAHDAILVEEYFGALDVVKKLREQGVETAVLSNTCARHWERLSQMPSVQRAALGGEFLSFEMGLVKPEEAIYASVQTSLGVAPEAIGFIDDSPANVNTALALGWRAVAIEHEREDSQPLELSLKTMGFEI